MTRRIAALLLIALVAPLAACGGDDDDGGDAGGDGELTKAEYIAAADEICKDNNDAGEDLEAPAEDDSDDLARFFTDGIEILEETRDRLADLDPPADAEAINQSQVTQLDDGIEAFKEARDLAEDGDYEGAIEIVNEVEPDRAADQLAADYGLEVCGSQEASE
jgi:hypothetical protein